MHQSIANSQKTVPYNNTSQGEIYQNNAVNASNPQLNKTINLPPSNFVQYSQQPFNIANGGSIHQFWVNDLNDALIFIYVSWSAVDDW